MNTRILNGLSILIMLVLSTLVTGCGSGSIDKIIDEHKVPIITLKGTTPLISADVSVIIAGTTQVIGTGVTDNNGSFSIDLEMPSDEIVLISVQSNSTSQVECMLTECGQDLLIGDMIGAQFHTNLVVSNFHYAVSPPNWETREDQVSVNLLSSISSRYLSKMIENEAITATNTTPGNFNAIRLDAEKLMLGSFDISIANPALIRDFIPGDYSTLNDSQDQLKLALANNVLTNVIEGQLIILAVINGIDALLDSHDMLNEPEAISAFMQLADLQAIHGQIINEQLIVHEALCYLEFDMLMTLYQDFNQSNISNLVTALESEQL